MERPSNHTGVRLGRILLVGLTLSAAAGGLAAWSGGFGSRVGGADLYVLFLAKYRYAAQTYLKGRLPLWNPYEYCGLPLLATMQGGALYAPVIIVNMLLARVPALQVTYHLHLTALVLLTLLYLTRAGLGLTAAAAGTALGATALFTGLGGVAIDHPNYFLAVTYVPAILLAWDALLDGHWGAAPVLALLAGIQWLPGHPDIPLDMAVLLPVMAALSRGLTLARRVALAVALMALGAALAAGQLLPLGEATAESTREGEAALYAFSRSVFAVRSWNHLVAWSLQRYGAAGVFCVLVGLLTYTTHRRAWATALLWATFATNRPFVHLYDFWPYAGLRFSFGWAVIAPFFAGCLAAAGVHRLQHAHVTERGWLGVGIGAGLAAILLALRHPVQAAIAAACGLGTWVPLRRHGAWIVPALLLLPHAAGIMARVGTTGLARAPDLQALAPRVAVLRREHETLPAAPRIVSGKEVRAGIPLIERLPSPTGHEPALLPRRVDRLGRHLGLDLLAFGREAAAWRKLAASPQAAAAVGVGIVAVPAREAEPLLRGGYTEAARLPDGDIVLYREPVPRFHLVHRVVRAADEEESFRLLIDGGFDPARSAILEAEPPLPVAAPSPGGTMEHVRVVTDWPEHIRLRATLESPGLLVASDTYFPGWEVRVDGVPAPLLRANYTFRAVALGDGEHEVEFVYRPRAFRLGAVISVLALALTGSLWLVARRLDTSPPLAISASRPPSRTCRSSRRQRGSRGRGG